MLQNFKNSKIILSVFYFAKLKMDPKRILETTRLLNIGIDEELLPVGGNDKADDEAIELIQ